MPVDGRVVDVVEAEEEECLSVLLSDMSDDEGLCRLAWLRGGDSGLCA